MNDPKSEESIDMVTCGGSCSLKKRKQEKQVLKGDDFKSIGSFHTNPIDELVSEEIKKFEIEKKEDKDIIGKKKIDIENIVEIKKLFMHDPNTTYLNHGAFGSPFIESFEYSEELRKKVEFNPVRFFDRDLFQYLAKAIVRLADFLYCDPFLLMPLANATSGLNAVFRYLNNFNLENKTIKKIVCFDITYASTLVMIEDLFNTINQSQNNNPYIINIPLKYLKASEEQLIDYIVNSIPEDTDLIVLDHISSQSCVVLPLKKLIEKIRNSFQLRENKEIIILVDGAHTPGNIKLNIKELDADFYIGNLHKWLCSCRGGGFIYISDKHINKIKGTVVSHGHGNKTNLIDSFYWDGNRDYSGFLSVIKTLEIWQLLETQNVYGSLKTKHKKFVNYLCVKFSVESLYNYDSFNSLMSLIPLPEKLQSFTPKSIQDWLHYSFNIEITIKRVYEKNCMRLSTHIYNSFEEIELLAKIILQSNIEFK